jgi:hypothetical protein
MHGAVRQADRQAAARPALGRADGEQLGGIDVVVTFSRAAVSVWFLM